MIIIIIRKFLDGIVQNKLIYKNFGMKLYLVPRRVTYSMYALLH